MGYLDEDYLNTIQYVPSTNFSQNKYSNTLQKNSILSTMYDENERLKQQLNVLNSYVLSKESSSVNKLSTCACNKAQTEAFENSSNSIDYVAYYGANIIMFVVILVFILIIMNIATLALVRELLAVIRELTQK